MISEPFAPPSHSPQTGDPALKQWLGVLADAQRYALPVTWVNAVFRVHTLQQKPVKVIDVVAHAGAPVFIANMSVFFEGIHPPINPSERLAPWVVISTQSDDPLMGFRVEQIKGPFRAEEKEGWVSYEGVSWKVPTIMKRVIDA
jgi:hypothetical protein